MLPAGPLSMTTFGEMLSSRQPFSVSPSDSTRELVPVTAKIAMRKSGPITRPVSLISRNGESASLAEDGFPWRACEFSALRVCPVVWEGWHREVSPYPDLRRISPVAVCPREGLLTEPTAATQP